MFPDLTRDDVFTLETARLWLRWPRVADAAAIKRLAGNKAVADMTARIPHPYPENFAENFVFNTRKSNALGETLAMAITRKGKPNALVGMIGLHPKVGPTEVLILPMACATLNSATGSVLTIGATGW